MRVAAVCQRRGAGRACGTPAPVPGAATGPDRAVAASGPPAVERRARASDRCERQDGGYRPRADGATLGNSEHLSPHRLPRTPASGVPAAALPSRRSPRSATRPPPRRSAAIAATSRYLLRLRQTSQLSARRWSSDLTKAIRPRLPQHAAATAPFGAVERPPGGAGCRFGRLHTCRPRKPKTCQHATEPNGRSRS